MELKEIYSQDKSRAISFEIFPPKNGDISTLFDELRILKKYKPALISLTYGADGSTRDFSIELLKMISDLELTPMPHLTCVCTNKELVEHYIVQMENIGIENILALRGNLPQNQNFCNKDFKFANELVDFIQQKTTLSIGVAGYPYSHIESMNLKQDIENLKRKVDSGASAIFTQMFFENEVFYKFVENVRNAGISVPIIAGILPDRNLTEIHKMTKDTNVTIPIYLEGNLEKYQNDAIDIGVDFATQQVLDLIKNKVDGIHFYTLNKSDMVSKILNNLNI